MLPLVITVPQGGQIAISFWNNTTGGTVTQCETQLYENAPENFSVKDSSAETS